MKKTSFDRKKQKKKRQTARKKASLHRKEKAKNRTINQTNARQRKKVRRKGTPPILGRYKRVHRCLNETASDCQAHV